MDETATAQSGQILLRDGTCAYCGGESVCGLLQDFSMAVNFLVFPFTEPLGGADIAFCVMLAVHCRRFRLP